MEYNKAVNHGPGSWDRHPYHEYDSFPLALTLVQDPDFQTGQVEIRLAFSTVSSGTQYLGYGNQPMNATAAAEFTGFADLVLSWKFAGFLRDPAHSVDLTPQSERAKVCGLNASAKDSSGCNQTYFIAGESAFVMPELIVDASSPDADIILASDHRGYLLNFNAGNSSTEFNSTRDCRTYSSRYLGAQAGAIRLCVGNSSPNELEARKLIAHSYFAIGKAD